MKYAQWVLYAGLLAGLGGYYLITGVRDGDPAKLLFVTTIVGLAVSRRLLKDRIWGQYAPGAVLGLLMGSFSLYFLFRLLHVLLSPERSLGFVLILLLAVITTGMWAGLIGAGLFQAFIALRAPSSSGPPADLHR